MSTVPKRPMRPRKRISGLPELPEATAETAEVLDAPPLKLADDRRDDTDTAALKPAVVESSPTPATPAPRPERPVRAVNRASTESAAPEATTAEVARPGGHRNQSNFRLFDSEASYLRAQVRQFEDHGIRTDATELVHALIYAARRGELEPIEILRRWRKDLNEI